MSAQIDTITWQPQASNAMLRARAEMYQAIRQFFQLRDVLEVETPLLATTTVADPHIDSLTTTQGLYLQTSPEFYMKRLLAAGSGCIFQICKAFRAEEQGRRHNQEFTMLEWYRLGFDHHQLMDEMDVLLQTLLACDSAERMTYAEVFQYYADIDPHQADCRQLKAFVWSQGMSDPPALADDKDAWLDLIMSHWIEPQLGQQRPLFIYDYPASQAALARIRPGNPACAERFEVYMNGMELANGFHELCDVDEQQRRFCADLAYRQQQQQHCPPLDTHLLAALQAGLPACAGVALGLDRLLMVRAGVDDINKVLSFVDHCFVSAP